MWVFEHCTRTVSESFHEREVRLENVLVPQPFRTHPFEALSVETLGLTVEALDNPHGELHVAIVVRVLKPHVWATRRDINTQLFPELACESSRLRFARGHFATRKFPAASHVLTGRALGDKNTAVAVIKRGCHDEQCRPHGRDCPRLLQRAVTVLELLPRTTGAQLVAAHLTVPAHERSVSTDWRRKLWTTRGLGQGAGNSGDNRSLGERIGARTRRRGSAGIRMQHRLRLGMLWLEGAHQTLPSDRKSVV